LQSRSKKDVDGRDKPGHDENRIHFKLLAEARKCWLLFQSGSQDDGNHLRVTSVAPSAIASNTGDASTAWTCSVPAPQLRKPCFRPGGTISDWPSLTIARSA